MKERYLPDKTTPEVFRAAIAFDDALEKSGLDPALRELIFVRASQINGCAYCIDAHTKEARAQGETEQRIYGLSAWREAPFYSERERAALALTEAVTVVSDGQVPDGVYDAARAVLDEKEAALVVWAAIVINTWNRLAIAARLQPGDDE